MKKLISYLMLILIVMTSMCAYTSASAEVNEYTCEVNGTQYTVQFENIVTSDKQKLIAQSLIGENDPSVQPYGLGCTLFGHDYAYTMVSVVQHKIFITSPRCIERVYDVTYCEDCDYTEETLLGTTYIHCCPED